MNQTDVISGFPMVLTLPAYADSLQHAPPSPDIVKQHRPKEALPGRFLKCILTGLQYKMQLNFSFNCQLIITANWSNFGLCRIMLRIYTSTLFLSMGCLKDYNQCDEALQRYHMVRN
ncbi:hypothetical protein SeLEV6574_g01947 [Synchytrium endobioticum]|uniref:Uncharacterized protein n=1 Tax=Synchytrium endobioticum TaxID=286115 RepID=A0A507DA74_9FUNG|nr:hypothetical protein SeLEV6574_g01947 [Synchytrium endobioticum]